MLENGVRALEISEQLELQMKIKYPKKHFDCPGLKTVFKI